MRARRDDGAGTVLAIAVIGVAMMVALALLAAIGAAGAGARAQSAADAAALAGAGELRAGRARAEPDAGRACALAAQAARRSGGVQLRCVADTVTGVVRVQVAAAGAFAGTAGTSPVRTALAGTLAPGG